MPKIKEILSKYVSEIQVLDKTKCRCSYYIAKFKWHTSNCCSLVFIITIYNNCIYSYTVTLKCELYASSAEAEKTLLYFTVRIIFIAILYCLKHWVFLGSICGWSCWVMYLLQLAAFLCQLLVAVKINWFWTNLCCPVHCNEKKAIRCVR